MVSAINSHEEFVNLVRPSLPSCTLGAHSSHKTNGSDAVVIDFWATWCGPCRVISPIFESLEARGHHPGVKFHKVDVDEQPEIAEDVGIRAMPTFIAFKDGQKVDELVGADPERLSVSSVSALL
ncbi:thioredoxin [Cryptococcus wingfieldii CBS 7118]|uniref:Thioredoxin n=1 Tax=Cryptococcus wingfieldii CBS 7118 TaxID=1295528 RepID=A0A1E3K2S5_9TREE|nr:thioredoxin [Cryptococcus wingfieldii CBS 7118]ODO07335.1 thioredoxin [Cryptococcus wingfieldii CBS 7118]